MSALPLWPALLLGALFLATLLAPGRLFGYPPDLLAPHRVAAGLHFITIVPYLATLHVMPDAVSPLLREHPSIARLEDAIAWYVLVQAIAFLALLMGIRLSLFTRIIRRAPIIGWEPGRQRVIVAAAVATVIGVSGFHFAVVAAGGYAHLAANLHLRAHLTSGAGYIGSLTHCISLAAVLLVYLRRYGISRRGTALLVAGVAGAVFLHSYFGGRKDTLHMLLMIMLVQHYAVARIRRPLVTAGLLLLVIVPYFLVMPVLRSRGGVEQLTQNASELGEGVQVSAQRAAGMVSYVDHYVLITSHFRPDNLWWGRSYLGLLAAPIPRRIFPEKPPVDDGMYVRTLAGGREVLPPAPVTDLYFSSWPPETLGSMYMNFWVPGVILGMMVLGVIYRSAYDYLRVSRSSLVAILIYAMVMLNMQLSVLRIVQTMILMAIVLGVFVPLFQWHRRATRRVRQPPDLAVRTL